MSVVIAYCSCPDARTPAAPALSLARWSGRAGRGTVSENLATRLQSLHPYELPEWIAVEAVGGHAPYLAWIAEHINDDDD